MNSIILMGRLTKDPETRYHANGTTSITRFTIAVERKYKLSGEDKPRTDFINCFAWNKKGEMIAKHFGKGNMIAVRGSVETGSYDKNGNKVYTTEVNVDEVSFTGERRERKEENTQIDNYGFMNIPDGIDEDLPFN